MQLVLMILTIIHIVCTVLSLLRSVQHALFIDIDCWDVHIVVVTTTLHSHIHCTSHYLIQAIISDNGLYVKV